MRAKTYPRSSNWFHLFVIGSSAAVILTISCSLLNREGPDVSCADLDNGAQNACKEGIIATCTNSTVVYKVCDDKNVCEASWQSAGEYRCTESETLPVLEVSGAGGTGGIAGTGGTGGSSQSSGGSGGGGKTCGFTIATASCASCVQANCCTIAVTCSQNADCVSCMTRPASASQCVPGMVGAYDNLMNCLSSMCASDC